MRFLAPGTSTQRASACSEHAVEHGLPAALVDVAKLYKLEAVEGNIREVPVRPCLREIGVRHVL